MPDHLIPPYGGSLGQLLVPLERKAELREASRGWPSWTLEPRQLCDLELLACGAFSPLPGFMTRADWQGVIDGMRLADGTFWPVPITLDVAQPIARDLPPGAALALRDPEGVMLAALHVEDVWQGDGEPGAGTPLGPADRAREEAGRAPVTRHPSRVGGRLEVVQLPIQYDYRALRLTPEELRRELARLGWRRVLAFQPAAPIHRAEHAMALQAAKEVEASLLIQPLLGRHEAGDVSHYSRIRCLQAAVRHFPASTAKLSLLSMTPRRGSWREILLRAIVARNCGCTHLLVSPEEVAAAGPQGAAVPGEGGLPGELPRLEAEIGVHLLAGRDMVFVEEQAALLAREQVPPWKRVLALDDAELRRRLAEGREIPAWFTFPEVAAELQRANPPRHSQGFTVFFTGLSGAGKSTVANVLLIKLLEIGGRPVTLLDGDIVRRHLSSELGFSKEHRDINIRRIGFVASEITKNGGIALCAPIAPYDLVRKDVRRMIEPCGGFLLVHVATPLEVCEQRDRKGLYAKARAGLLPQFTGISDPYERPEDADIVLDTTDMTPEEAAQEIVLVLEGEGYIGGNDKG